MFETKKIDIFFDANDNLLEKSERVYVSRRLKVVRFFKLFLPCVTALFLGLGVVLFDFNDTNNQSVVSNKHKKIYFEKLHIKNTVFEISDKNNRFSVLKAKIIKETKANSKMYSLTNPYAETFDDDMKISILSDKGQYNQNEQMLFLSGNVTALYGDEFTLETSSASYDFSKEVCFGNDKVTGHGQQRRIEANSFKFDKAKSILELYGDASISDKDNTLHSPDKITLFDNQNKLVAINAVIDSADGKKIKGDLINIHFKNNKNHEIAKIESIDKSKISINNIEAFSDKATFEADNNNVILTNNVKIISKAGYVATGDLGIYDTTTKVFTLEKNVKIKKDKSTIMANKAVYYQNIEEIHLFGNIDIQQNSDRATANKGVYYVKKNIAELTSDVTLYRDGNKIMGDKVVSDFTTSKTTITASSGKRVSGKLLEDSFK